MIRWVIAFAAIVTMALVGAFLWSAWMQKSFDFDPQTFFVCFISLLALAVAMLVIGLIRSLFK